MASPFTEAWEVLAPRRGNPHGPLPPLLLILTFVTGLVDAFSYLELGRVFVANMTGNVVFLSFALGGAPGFVWWASVLAILAFVLGSFAGGAIARRAAGHRARHLLLVVGAQAATVLLALVIALLVPAPEPESSYGGVALAALVVLLALAMGLQNSVARSLRVPDLTTTVLTLTITGLGSDSRAAGGGGSKLGRRGISILAMFAGGLVGVLMIRAGLGVWLLALVLALLVVVVAVAARHRASAEEWTKPA